MAGVADGSSNQRGIEEWQGLIAASFLAPTDHPVPVILFLDDEEMKRLWPDEPDPVGSLTAAVRDRLHLANKNPYRSVDEAMRRWHRGDLTEPPPCLPLLAVTVLAATRMRSDGTASSSASYHRFAQLLWRPEDPFPLSELQERLTEAFPSVVEAWKCLHDWISLQAAEMGESTIQTHPFLTRIGYPLSQALVRASDRDKLTLFFDAIGPSRLPTLSDDALFRGLAVWSSRPRGFSAAFSRSLQNQDDAQAFGRAIKSLADAWNGLVVVEGGRRRLPVRLLIDLENWSYKRVVRLVDGLDRDSFDLANGTNVTLRRPEYGDYFDISADLTQEIDLTRRFRSPGRASTLVQDPQLVWVLRTELSNGHWVSEPTLEPYRTHLLVVHSSLVTQFEEALRQVADDGWRLVPQKKPLVQGFAMFTDVTLSNPSRFEAASVSLPMVVKVSLRPESPPVPVLIDGLPVARTFGRNHYLLGGEPNLLLPVGGESRLVEASLDGVAQRHPFRATGFPIPLHDQRLEEGPHEITADGIAMSFYLHREDPSVGMRDAHFVDLETGGHKSATAVRESLIRYSRGVIDWLVSPDGSVLLVAAAAPPSWLGERGFPEPYYYKVEGEYTWHVAERDGVFRKPRRLGATQLPKLAPDAASVAFWKRAAQQDWTGADPDWKKLATIAPLAAWLGRQ